MQIINVAVLSLAFAVAALAQNFSNAPARLSIQRHGEGLGLRVVSDAGVFYTPRVGDEFGQWTNLPSRISNDTNEVFWMDGHGTKFFQVVADDQMRFPVWRDWVETKLTFNFQPVRRAGTFHLETYADGQFWGGFQGDVSQWADPSGTVWLEDGGNTPVDGYPYHEFVTYFTWTPPEPGAMPYTKVLKKRQRRRGTYRGAPGNRGIVVQQQGAHGSAPQPMVDSTQVTVFTNSLRYVTEHDLDGGIITASNGPPALLGPENWGKFKFLVLTNGRLTRLHYYGDGSPTHLGSAARPAERITTALLSSSPRLATNLFSYVALDGFVCDDGLLLQHLLGYSRLQDFGYPQPGYQGGWQPCFGWGWSQGKTNFTNALHFRFVQDFYNNMGAGYSFRESYERARWLSNGVENVESRYFKPVGCFGCYFWQ